MDFKLLCMCGSHSWFLGEGSVTWAFCSGLKHWLGYECYVYMCVLQLHDTTLALLVLFMPQMPLGQQVNYDSQSAQNSFISSLQTYAYFSHLFVPVMLFSVHLPLGCMLLCLASIYKYFFPSQKKCVDALQQTATNVWTKSWIQWILQVIRFTVTNSSVIHCVRSYGI